MGRRRFIGVGELREEGAAGVPGYGVPVPGSGVRGPGSKFSPSFATGPTFER